MGAETTPDGGGQRRWRWAGQGRKAHALSERQEGSGTTGGSALASLIFALLFCNKSLCDACDFDFRISSCAALGGAVAGSV